MRPKDRIRRSVLLLALLLPLVGVTTAHANEDEGAADEARTYAREQLLRSARISVNPANREAGGLDELKQTLATNAERYRELAPEVYARALQLLGSGEEPGLIREGARLYRWLASAPAEGEGAEGPAESPTGYAGLRAAGQAWQGLVERAQASPTAEIANSLWLDPRVLALVDGRELEVVEKRAAVDARGAEVAERVRAFQAAEPPRGLLIDSTVAEKARIAQSLRKEAEDYEARAQATSEALDRMARAERLLKVDAGRLGFLIDEIRGKEGEDAKGDQPPSDELAKLQLEEIVNQQLLRLLYIAARRADLMRGHFEEMESHAKEEALAAEEMSQAFEAELSRMRRESQLQRLAAHAADLERALEEANQQAAEGPEGERPVWKVYAGALDHLRDVNRLTGEAVALRRGLEARAKPDCADDDEGCLPPDAPEEAPPAAESPEPAPEASDPLRRFRNPREERIDPNYVRDAAAMLDDPGWDAPLAAQHFVAVDDRIQALEGALTLVRDTASLRARFAAADKAAEEGLSQVFERAGAQGMQWYWYVRVRERREKILEPDRTAFLETVRSIDVERERIGEELVLFRDYRRQLLDLGSRSFQIRVQRTLDPERLEAAYDDLDATVERTGRWITFQGDDHAGTFVQRNWLMLLACLGVLAVSVLIVRVGRHRLDGMVRHMATHVPALRSEPVTVRAEEAQARREKAEQEAAARAAEEEALRQVSKEEADRQQKMGEGGYGGGEGA